MPMRWLNAFLRTLPRLRAEESIRRVQEGQIASGAMDKGSAEETWRSWLEQADPGRFEDEEEDYPAYLL
jgi:hypothetical protein